MARDRTDESRTDVVDAELEFTSIWSAALAGEEVRTELSTPDAVRPVLAGVPGQLVNPVTFVAVLALVAGAALSTLGRPRVPARRCIRCGRPFCHRCKSDREGHEYCSQCLHLFVLGDGLAPETKNRKVYEVERHERRTRFGRRILSLVFPGTAQILRGRVLVGTVLCGLWFAGILAWQPSSVVPAERLLGLDVRLDVLRGGAVPNVFTIDPLTLVGALLALVVWLVANASAFRPREA
jgi:hypothetical protein